MNESTLNSNTNLWPHAIVAWFLVFGSALAAWTTYAVRQNLDLVRADYYEEEIRFQSQLDRLNRTAGMRAELAIAYDATMREISLRLPPAHHLAPTGNIQFYRPSNASLDFRVPLALDATGRQRVSTDKLQGGLWKVRAQWNASGQDYFFEQIVVIDDSVATVHESPSKDR